VLGRQFGGDAVLGQLAVLTTALALGQKPTPTPNACDVDLGAWLHCNNPIAIQYLSRLTPSDIGKVLGGVRLSDGSFMARGYRLLGLPAGLGRGVHVVVVQRGKPRKSAEVAADDFPPGGEGAFVWVDRGGEPLRLPDWHAPAYESAYVLSGDVYTWKDAQPEHGVVEIGCVNPSWKRKAPK
jgi:hypothetical protein